MNAQQLKNAILQEAIEGRLVPQDPNDEPASVLLAKIRKEKEQLVKEGKLKKKDLEVKPISEDEIPIDIPESWEWVRLKSLVSVLGDGIHGTPEYDIIGKYYFINGNNLSKNKIVIKADTKKINEKEYQTYKKELNDKTILVSINGTIGNVGHYNGEPVILGKSACYYNLLDISFKSYVTMLMYTDYFLKYADENATGSTIKNVSLAVMNDFLIPLPPLAEHHRIVAKIEELLPKVEEYGKAQDELNKLNEELPERLKKSILQEAIEGRLVPQDPNDEPASVLLDKIRKEKEQLVKEGKLKKKDLEEKAIPEDEIPFEIPESWEWVRIEDYTNKVTDYVASGSFASLRENVKYYKEENYALLVKTKDFQNDFSVDLTFTDEKGYAFLENSNLFGGELILSNVGSIGKIFVVPYLNRKMTLAPNAIMVRLWNDNHRDWLFYLFQSSFGISSLYEISSATAIRKFNKTDFKKLIIPLPPLAEQKRIVEKIEQLFKEVDKLK